MKKHNNYFTILILICCAFGNPMQDLETVQWQFKSELINNNEAIIQFTGFVKPGWHTYSQFLEEGGPYPTRIRFDFSKEYMLLGGTEEKGNPTTVYDDIYEMHITKYAGKVDFIQRVKLNLPKVELKGKITYMVCNNETCIPLEKDFRISLEAK